MTQIVKSHGRKPVLDVYKRQALHLPKMIIDVARMTKGMVLVTGPAGSGKSTTLACIIDEINRTRNAHVITLEDPIEYLHRHKMSVVTQREICLLYTSQAITLLTEVADYCYDNRMIQTGCGGCGGCQKNDGAEM